MVFDFPRRDNNKNTITKFEKSSLSYPLRPISNTPGEKDPCMKLTQVCLNKRPFNQVTV